MHVVIVIMIHCMPLCAIPPWMHCDISKTKTPHFRHPESPLKRREKCAAAPSRHRPSHQYSVLEEVEVVTHEVVLSKREEPSRLRALTAETAGKLDVLALDGDTLGVDGAQVGVLKETDEVSL